MAHSADIAGDRADAASPSRPPARFRISLRGMMVVVAGAALTLAYLANGSTKLGCGSATVHVTFRIVDDRDGRPIGGAEVELWTDLSGPPLASAVTGADGCASATYVTGCTSYSGPFFRTYRCLNFGEGLRIEASGYQPVDTLVREYASDPVYHNAPSPPPMTVRLKRRP